MSRPLQTGNDQSSDETFKRENYLTKWDRAYWELFMGK